MKTTNLVSVILLTMLLVVDVPAASIEFELVAHPNNVQLLPQPKGLPGVSGDHLLQTADDVNGGTFNPDGCFSFNFMNQVGISEPCYPPGYADGIHSMTGSVTLEINLYTGGTVEVTSLAFEGYVAQGKPLAQQLLVQPGDPATDGNHGPVDGIPNSGAYAASATANWAFGISFDWYYDTPFLGNINMTFDNYQWSGFIIPVSELTTTGMAMTMLNDPLGYFAGTSEDFESWLLNEVKPRLPQDAAYLLFAQGEAHPDWSQCPGMSTNGIVGETIIAYAVQPPPHCGDLEHLYPTGDLNEDCRVDLLDLAVLALNWLECTAPE